MTPICPYCRTELPEEGGEGRLDCPQCATPHHQDCFAENGGCTVFGCSAAPADEAKISLTSGDLETSSAATARRPLTWATGSPSLSLGLASLAGPGAPPEAPQNVPPPPPPIIGTGVAPPPAPATGGVPATLRPLGNYSSAPEPKSRVIFVMLGIFLGIFGVHNFYAGYTSRAVTQLCLSILSCFFGAIVSWVWAIVEVCVVNTDASGAQFT